jgi:hypothetical protein
MFAFHSKNVNLKGAYKGSLDNEPYGTFYGSYLNIGPKSQTNVNIKNDPCCYIEFI